MDFFVKFVLFQKVSLLNIDESCFTYCEGGGRQGLNNLLKNRIDPEKMNEYISSDSPINFQGRNALEFGDDIGYNETIQKIALQQSTFEYIHTPIGKHFSWKCAI